MLVFGFLVLGVQSAFAQDYISAAEAETKLRNEIESIFPGNEFADDLPYQYTRSKFELYMHTYEHVASGFTIEDSIDLSWEELELAINHIDPALFTPTVSGLRQELVNFLSQ